MLRLHAKRSPASNTSSNRATQTRRPFTLGGLPGADPCMERNETVGGWELRRRHKRSGRQPTHDLRITRKACAYRFTTTGRSAPLMQHSGAGSESPLAPTPLPSTLHSDSASGNFLGSCGQRAIRIVGLTFALGARAGPEPTVVPPLTVPDVGSPASWGGVKVGEFACNYLPK